MLTNHLSLLSSALCLGSLLYAHGQLTARCGDCWCAPGDGNTCPADETGIDSFDADTYCVLPSFTLTNSPSFLELKSSDGSDCYPFTDSLGSLNNAPQTQLPACVVPSSTATSVCAYKYNPADTTCKGREYEVVTYDSEADAVADGASVTHSGGCGVCSSAQDLYVRIRDYDTLESNSVLCATVYTLSTAADRFDKLVQCYTDMGFTTPCATMWAHLGAANAIQCGSVCLPDSSGVTKLNEDNPPICEFAPCLECSLDFQADFDTIAGRTLYNSGITERIVRPCDVFTRIEHDHCEGTTEIGDDPCIPGGPAATQPPGGSPGTSSGTHPVTTLGLGGLAMLLWNTLMLA